jgi:hypothetical protein
MCGMTAETATTCLHVFCFDLPFSLHFPKKEPPGFYDVLGVPSRKRHDRHMRRRRVCDQNEQMNNDGTFAGKKLYDWYMGRKIRVRT